MRIVSKEAGRAGKPPAAPRVIPPAGEPVTTASFGIGEVVRHRFFPFRGIIFDVDPEFANTEEWWEAIPEEMRPAKDQPFYHLFAENDDQAYVAYVSQQNLLPDDSEAPVLHPAVPELFERLADGSYRLKPAHRH